MAGLLPTPIQSPEPITFPAGETLGERVRRMQAELREHARAHTRDLTRTAVELRAQALEIESGGEAYPPGVREVARRLAEDLDQHVGVLNAIAARQR